MNLEKIVEKDAGIQNSSTQESKWPGRLTVVGSWALGGLLNYAYLNSDLVGKPETYMPMLIASMIFFVGVPLTYMLGQAVSEHEAYTVDKNGK